MFSIIIRRSLSSCRIVYVDNNTDLSVPFSLFNALKGNDSAASDLLNLVNAFNKRLKESKDELAESKDELAKSKDELAKSKDKLAKSNDAFIKRLDELAKISQASTKEVKRLTNLVLKESKEVLSKTNNIYDSKALLKSVNIKYLSASNTNNLNIRGALEHIRTLDLAERQLSSNPEYYTKHKNSKLRPKTDEKWGGNSLIAIYHTEKFKKLSNCTKQTKRN